MGDTLRELGYDDWELLVNIEALDDGYAVRAGFESVPWAELNLTNRFPLAAQTWFDGENNRLTVLVRTSIGNIHVIDMNLDNGEAITTTSISGGNYLVSHFDGDKWDSTYLNGRAFFSKKGVTLVAGKELGLLTTYIDLPGVTDILDYDYLMSGIGRVKFGQDPAKATAIPYHEGSMGGSLIEEHQGSLWMAGFSEDQLLHLNLLLPDKQDLVPEDYIDSNNRANMFLDSKTLIWSEQDNPFALPADNFEPLPDGPITGLKSFRDMLVIFTPYSVWVKEGDPTSYTLRKVADGPGTNSPKTIQSTERGLVWLGRDNVYLFDGERVSSILPDKLRQWVFERRQPIVFPKANTLESAASASDYTGKVGYPWFFGTKHDNACGGIRHGRKQYWIGLEDAFGQHGCYTSKTEDDLKTNWSNNLAMVWDYGKNKWFLYSNQYTRDAASTYRRGCESVFRAEFYIDGPDGNFYSLAGNSLGKLVTDQVYDGYIGDYSDVGSSVTAMMISKPLRVENLGDEFWNKLHVWMDAKLGQSGECRAYIITDKSSYDTTGTGLVTQETEVVMNALDREDMDYILDEAGNAFTSGFVPVRRDHFHQKHSTGRNSFEIRFAILIQADDSQFRFSKVGLQYSSISDELER
jgi:hypothetical protein